MKNNRFFSIAALCTLLAAGFTACTADDSSLSGADALPESGDSSIKSITMTAHDFLREDGTPFTLSSDGETSGAAQTRTSVTMSPQGALFQWTPGDTVGIFPNSGAQAYFPIKEGSGSNTAKFDGGGWALRASSHYMAYYPLIHDFDLDKTRVPVSYPIEITQNGNGSLAHIDGKVDFMAASATTPQSGNVNFDFQHLGALVELSFKMPKASQIKYITLRSADQPWYTTKGTVNLTETKLQMIPTAQSCGLVLKLEDVTTTTTNAEVKAYFMMVPTTLGENQVKVIVNGYEGYLPAKTLVAGNVYAMKVNLVKSKVPKGCVDLGLSVYWADHNVGAMKPEENGDYFSWGETQTKINYNSSVLGGQQVGSIAGNVQYDAATANWGAPWRMPTEAELKELANTCVRTWTNQDGKSGYLIHGRGACSGNSIFLPATGYQDGTSLNGKGSNGYYWSASPDESDFGRACSLVFNIYLFGTYWDGRFYGRSVRPVQDK